MSKTKSGQKTSDSQSKKPLKLYIVRISPCSRVVWLYLLQNKIPVDIIDVDVFQGQHKDPKFVAMNPHREVPVLVDRETTIFGGVASLRYLAAKYTDYVGWGKTLEKRTQVQSILQWASCDFHRVLGYKHVYPNFLEKYQLATADGTETMIEKAATLLTKCLEKLESFYLKTNPFLCGMELTIADTYVATVLCQGEWVSLELKMWPRVATWLKKVKGQEKWHLVHEQHETFLHQLTKCPWED